MIKKDIDKFIVGRWYRCITKERHDAWCDDGRMDYLLDGQWRKCLNSSKTCCTAKFLPQETSMWGFVSSVHLFEECEYRPTISFKEGNYYRWRGPDREALPYTKMKNWNSQMDDIRDGKWHRCKRRHEDTLVFEGILGLHYYGHVKDFLEESDEVQILDVDVSDPINKTPFFEVDHWYKAKVDAIQVPTGIVPEMEEFFKSNKWYKCIRVTTSRYKAEFEGIEGGSWYWLECDISNPKDFYEKSTEADLCLTSSQVNYYIQGSESSYDPMCYKNFTEHMRSILQQSSHWDSWDSYEHNFPVSFLQQDRRGVSSCGYSVEPSRFVEEDDQSLLIRSKEEVVTKLYVEEEE